MPPSSSGWSRGHARCTSTAWVSNGLSQSPSGEALRVWPVTQGSPNRVFIMDVCHHGSGLVSQSPSVAALAVIHVSWSLSSNHLRGDQGCGTCPLMMQRPQTRCRCQKRRIPVQEKGAQRAQSAECGRPALAKPAAAALHWAAGLRCRLRRPQRCTPGRPRPCPCSTPVLPFALMLPK